MDVAELLVSHGASLNAKTFLEETPIGRSTPSAATYIHHTFIFKTVIEIDEILQNDKKKLTKECKVIVNNDNV